MALIKLNNQSLSAVTSAGLPSGTVLQVQQGTTSTHYTISALDTYEDIGLSVNITPISSSNKILLMLTGGSVFYNTAHTKARILRDSTTVVTTSTFFSGADWQGWNMATTYMDSPATTSQITYKVQGFQDNSAVNNHANFVYNSDSVYLIAMEIAG